ncbi:metal-dependent hydrolase [Bordetella avium]|uniref:metal-dependent hydrolase n=1 Tax=Bordetella avium TaxID=521 RepID=UPI000E6A8EDD|nr:metal-dependent hydrolase [Bordetella avium]AZY52187.1 hydrolase [Bordetella avium]RIQ17988.1 metal-dependent hydrolase [Bordetella avium]RIQ36463.1 metal-dependent hydrolase [Bordetella avium]RIQ72979.1 metal-dependent hydrolase [Bordetella avium]
MDSVTQAVLGAGIQATLLGRWQGRRALLYGAALATLPDLDVLIRYPDPVSSMTYHRGFSHSIFVLTAFALLLMWLIRKRWPAAKYSAARLFLTLWLVLVTHPLLDAFTVYGTQLFWPIPWIPESWSSVFIIDPVYTLPLLFAVLAAGVSGVSERMRRILGATLLFSTAYLFAGLAGRFHAEREVTAALRAQGVQPTQVLATPTPMNILLWRVMAKTDGDQYYEALSGWFDRQPPEIVAQPLNLELGQALAGDALLARLRWFTNDWLRFDAMGDNLVVTDLRMGMPGYHNFRFVMGERDNGQWRPVTPARWPADRGGWNELRQLWARIAGAPLPLADWAKRNFY